VSNLFANFISYYWGVSTRSIFPKDTEKWINWINDGKGLYYDKKRILNFLGQQRTNPADVVLGLAPGGVTQESLESATNIIQNFENPTINYDKLPLFKSTISALEVRTETEKQIVDKLTEIQNRTTNARPLILARNEKELREQLTKLNIGKRYQDAIVNHFNKKGAVGFYDPTSKSVIINPSKVINKEDAVAVWLHEMGIHAGLENILPAGAFNEIMEKVYDFFENEAKTNQAYKEVFDSVNNDPIYEGSDKSTKGEELLGKMGENSGEGAHRIMSSVTFGKYRRCFKGRPDN